MPQAHPGYPPPRARHAPHRRRQRCARRQTRRAAGRRGDDERNALPGEGVETIPDEGGRVAALLGRLHRGGGEVEVTKPLCGGAHRIGHRVTCGPADRTRSSASAELWLTNAATDTATPLKVTVRWTDFGARCWLNVQANLTSLLTGGNALAAKLGAHTPPTAQSSRPSRSRPKAAGANAPASCIVAMTAATTEATRSGVRRPAGGRGDGGAAGALRPAQQR
jgi:hypothetical protein